MALIYKAIFGFEADPTVWDHALKNVVPSVIYNTFMLAVLTLLFSLTLGLIAAWLCSFTNFKYKKLLHFLSIVPLIFPLYVLAFIYVGLFEYSSGFMEFFRESLDINLHSYFKIKSILGSSLIFSFGLFPYVYLMLKQSFDNQGPQLFQVSRSLGLSKIQTFFKISIPMARPWILAATTIILMETLADFGAVSVFNVDTFTTAIYQSWTGMYSLSTATKLSTFLIVVAIFILLIEVKYTEKQKYTSKKSNKSNNIFILSKSQQLIASVWLLITALLTFIIPITQLLLWVRNLITIEQIEKNIPYLLNSIKIALTTAIITTIVALLVCAGAKLINSKFWTRVNKASTLGYAIPGSIIAVAVFSLFTQIKSILGPSIDQNTFLYIILIVGLMTRFLSLAFKSIESALKKISNNTDKAARSMGARPIEILHKIYIPIIKGGISSAFIMIFIEVMKEMPMTLMLRPFGHDTLSVKVYEFTSEGEWEKASIAGLMIVLTGMISVALLIFSSRQKRERI